MTDEVEERHRRGREATTAVILDAAEELFSARGYSAVAVRDIAERAGVSHPLVHQYVGTKDKIFRAVLTRNESLIVSAAPDNPDLLASASLMLRRALLPRGRAHVKLLVRSALNDLPYDRTPGRFEATERLIELAERAAASAPRAERAGKDLDPRVAVACAVALLLGWVATESWLRLAAGLRDMDDAELIDALERAFLGILRDNVPGVERDDPRR